MINPSINGWVDKFFSIYHKEKGLFPSTPVDLYTNLRKSGIIYGHVVKCPFDLENKMPDLSTDEKTKIVFLQALYEVYLLKKNDSKKNSFLSEINTFYSSSQKNTYFFLDKLLPEASESLQLESIINDRIQINKNLITKSFSHIVTNAFLFLDVVAFYQFLDNAEFQKKYLENFEKKIYQIIVIALTIKNEKTSADELLVKLFENSLRYTKKSEIDLVLKDEYDFSFLNNLMEKLYFFDLILMSLWSDKKLDANEIYFVNEIAEKLSINQVLIHQSLIDINNFIEKNKKEISYFNDHNPIKNFYNQTNTTVIKLINRNKKRLTKEIKESKELMILLAKSTSKDLNHEEKKKVKKQLLDICKTIPSLTIFLLPGGGILLPILVKYIPQLLPSAFNENLEED